MPARESRRGRQRAPRRKTRARAPIGKSLLILECDTTKLARQALSMADAIEATTNPLAPGAQVAVVKSLTEQHLLSQLAQLAQTDSRFRIIVVVGHSSESGLQLASDRYVSWRVFANWVQPFDPKQIILIACKGGQLAPTSSLFDGIPTLQDVYASPLVTTRQQVQAIRALVPYLLNARSPDADLIRLGQLVNFLLTQGAIWRWRRNDFRSTGLRSSR